MNYKRKVTTEVPSAKIKNCVVFSDEGRLGSGENPQEAWRNSWNKIRAEKKYSLRKHKRIVVDMLHKAGLNKEQLMRIEKIIKEPRSPCMPHNGHGR